MSPSTENTDNKPSHCRYTIHIPSRDKDGNELKHVLPILRKLLTKNNIPGRLVLRKAEADWDDTSHPVDLLMIDINDHPDTDKLIKSIAENAKELGKHEGIYITKMPLTEFWVV